MKLWGWPRTAVALAAAATAAVIFPACSPQAATLAQPSPTTTPAPTSASGQITVPVSADAPVGAELVNVVDVSGPTGSVTGPGFISLAEIAADAMDAPAIDLETIGPGVDVQVADTTIARDLTLTFPDPGGPGGDSLVPVVLHLSDDGQWNLVQARLDEQGSFVITAQDFSVRWPGWLDIRKPIAGFVDSVVDSVVGRTDPDDCRGDGPQWAHLDKKTSLVHTCVITQPDDAGVERAEAQLKSNRRFYATVRVPGGADYVWNEQGGALAEAASAILPVARGPSEHLLFPQSRLTAGFYQPDQATSETFTVFIDHWTAAMSLSLSVASTFVPDSRAGWAALIGLGLCADQVPPSISDGDAYWDFTRCLIIDALPSLANPDKAVSAARSLYDGVAIKDVRAMGRSLDQATNKLRLLGQVVKIAGAGFAVRDIYQQIPDAFSQMGADRTGDVLWALDPKSTRPTLSDPYHVFHREHTLVEYDSTTQYGLVALQDGDQLALTWLSYYHRPCFRGVWDGEAYVGTYADLESFPAQALPYVADDGTVHLRVWADRDLYTATNDEDWATSTLQYVEEVGAEMPGEPIESAVCPLPPP